MSQEQNIQDDVDEVVGLVSDDYDVSEEEVKESLQEFYDYGVVGEQAINSTLSKLATDRDISRNELVSQGSDGGEMSLTEFGDSDWGNVRAVVVDKQEASSDVVAQRGLINDGEVTRSFVVWANGTEDVPELEQDETYFFESVVGNEDDNGNIQIQINKSSDVSPSSEEVEPSGGEIEFTGALLDTVGASGLIWRDAESNRVVDSNEGDVEEDLRLMLAIDDGKEVYTAHFDKELTEEITGISIEDAKEIAMDAMDREAVVSEMLPDLIGRYMTVRGNQRDNYIFVDEYEWAEDVGNVDELLMKAQSLSN